MRTVPGIHSVLEALRVRPRSVKEILLREGELKGELDQISDLARQHRIPVKKVKLSSLDRTYSVSQGVIAAVSEFPQWPEERIAKASDCLLFALDSLEDPHNLGAILRTSWTLGVDGVVLPKDRAVGLTPAVEKVASGAVDHVPVLEVTNLTQYIKDLKEQGFWVYALAENAKNPIHKIEFAKKTVLVVGSESSGIRTGVLEACDEVVMIPQANGAHNLNASIAASVASYEVLRQRRTSQKT